VDLIAWRAPPRVAVARGILLKTCGGQVVFDLFGWLRRKAREAVLGGIADAVQEVAVGEAAGGADLEKLRAILAATGGGVAEVKALPATVATVTPAAAEPTAAGAGVCNTQKVATEIAIVILARSSQANIKVFEVLGCLSTPIPAVMPQGNLIRGCSSYSQITFVVWRPGQNGGWVLRFRAGLTLPPPHAWPGCSTTSESTAPNSNSTSATTRDIRRVTR
jgi:hypothetical protein